LVVLLEQTPGSQSPTKLHHLTALHREPSTERLSSLSLASTSSTSFVHDVGGVQSLSLVFVVDSPRHDKHHSLLGGRSRTHTGTPRTHNHKSLATHIDSAESISTLPPTMARKISPTLSGLFAVLAVILLVSPVRAAWQESYCSSQQTGNTDVCEY
jgi:hypothetical protein